MAPPALRALAAAAAAAAAGFRPAAAGLSLVSLRSVDPLAVCSDGSPAGYYWEPATGNASMWLVDLQGGGWCHSEATCRARCRPGALDCSSLHWKAEVDMEGLFRPTRDPALAGANKVWVRYCTSDAHMGDAEAFGLQFRGARVLRAVVRDLVERRGLGGGATSDLMILGGQSAGARGAMVHLDYIPEMLGSATAARVEVVGLLDSPLWVDIPPFPGSSFAGFNESCRSLYDFANVTHLGASCAQAHPGADQWKCIMGQYRMPHIKTPYLLLASQYDRYQLSANFGTEHWTNSSEQKVAYAEAFASRTAELVLSLRASWPKTAARQNAVFSWACYNHATTTSSYGFDRGTCQGTTVDAAVLQFLGLSPHPGAAAAPRLQWLDTCRGFACGPGCHGEPEEASPHTSASARPAAPRLLAGLAGWPVLPLLRRRGGP